MSLVIVDATIVLSDAADRDALVADSVPLQRSTRDEEAGCLAYCFAADPVHPDRIQVYEAWESEEALHAHLNHANYFGMLQLVSGSDIASATSRKHRIERSVPVYAADGKPTGFFD